MKSRLFEYLMFPFARRVLGKYGSRWYTRAECERRMRKLTHGLRGCTNPKEHLL